MFRQLSEPSEKHNGAFVSFCFNKFGASTKIMSGRSCKKHPLLDIWNKFSVNLPYLEIGCKKNILFFSGMAHLIGVFLCFLFFLSTPRRPFGRSDCREVF